MRLVDFPYVVVRLDCNLCHRKGAYRLARLAVAFGAVIEDLLHRLASACPYRPREWERSRNQYKPRCHAQFVDLTERTLPDMPPGVGGLRVIDGGLMEEAPPRDRSRWKTS